MKRWIMAGAAIVAIAAGTLVVVVRRAPKPQAKVQTPVAAPAPADIVLSGRVSPRTTVAVTAPIEGILDTFFVDVGAEVIQGQLLGRVRNAKGDSSVQQAQDDLDRTQARLTALGSEQLAARLEVSRAEADRSRAQGDLDRSQKAYQRQKDLWAAGATARLAFEKSEKDYNDAKEAMDKLNTAAKDAAARAESIAREIETLNRALAEKTSAIEQAKGAAASGELHSPADGIVLTRNGQPGDMVDPSMKLMEIATELTALQAMASADAATLGHLHAGQAAVVRMGDQEIAGAVQEVRGDQVVVYFSAPEAVKKFDDVVQVRIKF